MRKRKPFVVYPPDWPMSRARSFSDLEAAERTARKMANESGKAVQIYITGKLLTVIQPAWESNRDMKADYDLAQSIGLDE